MKRVLAVTLFGLLIFAVAGCDLFAQATASISGTVRDQSGAVLPGVQVTATQSETEVSRMTLTNETGAFVLPNLAVGPYRLEAALPGFQTFVQIGIVLQVGASPVIHIDLQVGQVSQAIEVQSNTALVETRNSSVGAVMENQRILELPLNGRNITELISLSGAATPGAEGTTSRNPFATTVVSIAGGLSVGVNYTLDGANHNSPYANTYMSMPFPDALQEFKVETSAQKADSGMKSGGSVTLVTKSGTNAFHGDLFEFVRNGKFNARNAFALSRDTLKRNQFGGTIGGPIKANKLFFFAGYQGSTIRSDPAPLTTFVPTAAMMAGDWTTFASAACQARGAIRLGAPFVNNTIDPKLYSPAAVKIQNNVGLSADPCGRVLYGNQIKETHHMAIGRIDYQRNANHSMFGRYLADSVNIPTPFSLTGNLLSSTVNGSDGLVQSFVFGDTYLFGTNTVNSLRLAGNRMAANRTTTEFFTPNDVGIKMLQLEPRKGVAVNITGGYSTGATRGPTHQAVFNIKDDLSMVRGNHQLGIGVDLARMETNYYSNQLVNGTFQFRGTATGNGLADFLTGKVSLLTQADSFPDLHHQPAVGTYVADTWKATDRLTVNLGLRWEPFLPATATLGAVSHFDLTAWRQGVKTQQYVNAPPGVFFPGDPGFPGKTGMNRIWTNFSPRVGVAWDVSGDGRTSLRAAAGSFYDFPSVQFWAGQVVQSPFSARIQTVNNSFDDPYANYPGGNPFPLPQGRNAPWALGNVVSSLPYNARNPNVYQWNVSLQRQLGTDWLASASYMGSQSIHLWTMKQINPSVYLPGATTATIQQRRVLTLEDPAKSQYFGYMQDIDDGGTATYNGLLLNIQRRAVRGVTINANYTWSHCITDPYQPGIATGQFGDLGYIDPNNRRRDRGNCYQSASDRRQVFNMTAVAETPQFSNAGLSAVASHWRFAPIWTMRSGDYFTVTTATDPALTGIANQRVNQVVGDPYGDNTPGNYLNPKAFALPAPGTLGNLGTGAIRGPHYWTVDMALSRSFKVGDAKQLEFRAEAFNLTNSVRLKDPVTSFDNTNFGRITAAEDPRIMQFALKYVF